MEKADLIKYWIDSSNKDYQAMLHLLEKEDYSWSLFVGHLVIEKLIKAYYIKNNDSYPPFVHDLIRLTEKSGLILTEGQSDFLDTLSTFNIKAKYDDYKMDFYKKCSKEFTEKWISEIKDFREWIKKKL